MQQLASILHQVLAAVLSSELVPTIHIKREITDEKERDVACGQIWLNLPTDHHHFGYITKIDKKKHWWRAAGREGGISRQADYSVHTHIP